MPRNILIGHVACAATVASVILACTARGAEDKTANLTQSARSGTAGQALGAQGKIGGSGCRTTVGDGDTQIPVVVVRGTPYEMGWHLGRLTREEIVKLMPTAMARLKPALGLSDQAIQDAWARTAAYADDRFEQELLGLSDGSGVPLSSLQAIHTIPLLMPYSCSSIAAWGQATADGHLYQTRNLDWKLAVGAHDFPVIVIYLPTRGIPHVVPTFSGVIGAHTGMNVRGIVLSEMGDSPAKDAPYDVHASHFTVFFRSLLYDADSLGRALEIFQGLSHTKRYHYVFGDARAEHRAVKILAHAPEPPARRIVIWKDNDPHDEFAPRVLEQVVYNDEGRGAFPLLKQDYGLLNADKLIRIANQIPIRGGNVVNVVYDATALKLWVSYAKGNREAYLRPYTLIDLERLDADQDGTPDLQQVLH
jgi:isopenicillin-N N-acyltransferase like protein